jgi:thiol-disulfide isomerase/thioredoxin
MRRLLPALLCVVVAAAVAAAVIAATGERSEQPKSAAPPEKDARAALAGAPAPLAALHDQSSRLLDGGSEAFEKRLAALKGYPVVVNMWGSWCEPCRAEFPYFQSQAIKRGKRVAFLGVDGQDSEAAAGEFLQEYPVAYPSYKDPDLKIAEVIKAVGPFPATVFYDRKGEIVHLKQGGYPDERALAQDIGRYAR